MKKMKHLLLSLVGALVVLVMPGTVLAVEVVNLIASETGMHRITFEELQAQGAGGLAGERHQHIAVTKNGQPVQIRTTSKTRHFGRSSRFGPGGYIEFYVEPSNSQYTNDVAYVLHIDKQLRSNIGLEIAKVKKNQTFSETYQHTTLVEENRSYDFLAPSKVDPWHFGQIFGAGASAGQSYDFSLVDVQGSNAELSAEIYGIVDIPVAEMNDHHPEIAVNGTVVVDQQFDGNTIATLTASNVSVNEGLNSLRVGLKGIAGMPFDALALNRFSLTYTRLASALTQNDYVEGHFAAGQSKISGFSTSVEKQVYRKSANGLSRIVGTQLDGGTAVGFKSASAGDFVVVGPAGYKTLTLSAINDLEDIQSGDAEYLVITHDSFKGTNLDALVQLRQADYQVKVVDVKQIYGQFGQHVPSADAIHAYIKHAVANMGTRFVTFIGTDTYDYKNYTGLNSVSFIPTKYVSTPGGFLTIQQTPSDAKYGDVNDDDVPDIPVGRISVRTEQELGFVVEKIRDYQARVGYAGRIVIAADKEDVGNQVNFTDDANDLLQVIPQAEWRNAALGPVREGWRAYPDVDGDQTAHDQLITAINAGVSVAAYIGHSSQTLWASTTPILLTSSDVRNLTNIDKPALVTQWGCWNTYFVDPAGNSMGDQFLVAGETGAVAVLGASTLTTSNGERQLGLELNRRMYQPGMTIGEAVIQAKQAMAVTNPGATDIFLGWQILGDPALVVNH